MAVRDREAPTEEIVSRLASDRGVRHAVPGGTLHIDRPLPFICVVRRPPGDVTGLEGLVHGLGSYLVASDEQTSTNDLRRLLDAVLRALADRFGSVLALELWSGGHPEGVGERWTFRVHAAEPDRDSSTVACLVDALRDVDLHGMRPAAKVVTTAEPSPDHLAPVLLPHDATKSGCVFLGLEVPPLYIDPDTGRRFPLMYRDLQASLSGALRRAFFEFATVQTTFEVKDFRALGPRSILDPARIADEHLVELAEEIDFLLMVTPVDSERVWSEFASSSYADEPTFHYRPLPFDPDVMKRRLFDIELEGIEDPTLAAVFRAKRRELDRQLTMLEDRDTSTFLPGSVQLYDRAEDELCDLATTILERAASSAGANSDEASADAHTIAGRARDELSLYGDMQCVVQIRDDIPGILVDEGNLLIGESVHVSADRLDALLQHEIGTHVVTHANGAEQPLRLFRVGLPGYEQTQEGLATLAEYVVGGFNSSRLATLAARVLAVRAVLDGASFVETFRILREGWGFVAASAFGIAMRVHRSGGLTKDAIYLRGLNGLLGYVASGGRLESLLVGKLALDHIDIVEELLWRGVLHPPKIRPRWLDHPDADGRLAGIREGKTMAELVAEVSP